MPPWIASISGLKISAISLFFLHLPFHCFFYNGNNWLYNCQKWCPWGYNEVASNKPIRLDLLSFQCDALEPKFTCHKISYPESIMVKKYYLLLILWNGSICYTTHQIKLSHFIFTFKLSIYFFNNHYIQTMVPKLSVFSNRLPRMQKIHTFLLPSTTMSTELLLLWIIKENS